MCPRRRNSAKMHAFAQDRSIAQVIHIHEEKDHPQTLFLSCETTSSRNQTRILFLKKVSVNHLLPV